MKLNKQHNLAAVASPEHNSRFSTEHVLAEPIEGADKIRLTATDGRILASVPVDTTDADELAEPVLLPTDVWKYGRKARSMKRSEFDATFPDLGVVHVDNGKDPVSTVPHITASDDAFPKWRKVVPEPVPPRRRLVVVLNADLLKRLQDAIAHNPGAPAVRLEFDLKAFKATKNGNGERGYSNAIRVTSERTEDHIPTDAAIGVLMPLCVL